MRSRADLRRAAEWVLRAALLGGLALALWRSVSATGPSAARRDTEARGLPAALRDASRSARVGSVDVTIDSVPDAAAVAWLAALPKAGIDTRWRGGPPPLAVSVEAAAEPSAPARIAVVADSGRRVVLADSAGVLDTLATGRRGASLAAGALVGAVRAAAGRFVAAAPVADASPPRAVLVLGRASWEARFVAAALQEAGWSVRSRQPTAPGVAVADAGLLPIDTGRYGVVVALDSTAAGLAPAIARFVAQGGGLVLGGDAANLASFAALAPARSAARLAGRALLDADTVTPADLPRRPLDALRRDAVRLEGSSAEPTLVVRRAGLGRVAVLALDETWRWRMLGGATGMPAHRAWWSHTVGLVAPASDSGARRSPEAAPLASLVDALGPPSPARVGAVAARGEDALPLALLALLLLALLAEIASRRFRGAR